MMIKAGFRSITPYLVVNGADDLIAFMRAVFGAELTARHPRPDGLVMHAEVRVGDSMIELGDATDEFTAAPVALHVYIEDVDGVYERAVAAGATTTQAPTDQPYGDREAGVKDRWDNNWYVATHQENVTEEELQRRFAGEGNQTRKQEGVGPRPEGFHTITPYLHTRGAREFIAFLENAFGGKVVNITEMPDRDVANAAVRIGDSLIELGEAHGTSQPKPAGIHLYVPDADATYEQAVAAGATSIRPPEDTPYGERGAFVKDPFGNSWFIATPKG
jgi:PhnB protein